MISVPIQNFEIDFGDEQFQKHNLQAKASVNPSSPSNKLL